MVVIGLDEPSQSVKILDHVQLLSIRQGYDLIRVRPFHHKIGLLDEIPVGALPESRSVEENEKNKKRKYDAARPFHLTGCIEFVH